MREIILKTMRSLWLFELCGGNFKLDDLLLFPLLILSLLRSCKLSDHPIQPEVFNFVDMWWYRSVIRLPLMISLSCKTWSTSGLSEPFLIHIVLVWGRLNILLRQMPVLSSLGTKQKSSISLLLSVSTVLYIHVFHYLCYEMLTENNLEF